MLESTFQKSVIDELKLRLPGCMVFKMDPTYIQGTPDLLVLYRGKWAALEVKKGPHEHHQPNQDYYVDKMNQMSYAAFIDPTNKEDILNEVQRSLET